VLDIARAIEAMVAAMTQQSTAMIDVTPTSPSSSASISPSPYQGPITRSMMRKIRMGLSQDDQVNHGLFTLFTWAKEISKI